MACPTTQVLPSSSSQMEEIEGCDHHQRVYTFETNNMAMLANFSRRYVAYLLPALLKVGGVGSCRGSKDPEIEKTVRSEVDIALVLSASGFTWSRALKQKLEQEMNTRILPRGPTTHLVSSTLAFACDQNDTLDKIFTELWTSPVISRPLPPIISSKPKVRLCKARKPKRQYRSTLSSRRMLSRGDGELQHCMRSLRSVVPGGSEMGVHELFSEVESYVICLELQVSILRALVKE